MSRSDLFLIGVGDSSVLDATVVGNKAAGLSRLHAIGLPVPPALAIPAQVCRDYFDRGALPADFPAALVRAVGQLERATGYRIGGTPPLLLSVRSSPPHSMPGMLDTILDVGLTERAVSGLIRHTGNPWLAWDAYRRFVRAFAETLCGMPSAPLDHVMAATLSASGAASLQELDPLSLRDAARRSADLVRDMTGAPLPTDPAAQLLAAVQGVFRSWTSDRAREYRRLNAIDEHTGTGVLVQAMVFGNDGARSGSGVGFTRNPVTGEDELYVDFVFNAQGEDVVSGRSRVTDAGLPAALPDVWGQLQVAKRALEREFADMQDFEFTVDEGRLYFLQTRVGKRTPWAALRIASDLVSAGMIDRETAADRVAAYELDDIMRVAVRPGPADVPVARAAPAGIGAATGAIVFDTARAQQWSKERPVILVRTELSTDDVGGLSAAAGVLTALGARTSHAAVVARQLGKACLVGCTELQIDEGARVCSIGSQLFREGDVITLDGDDGYIYAGPVPIVREEPVEMLAAIRRWA